jgi:hypothetical protein
MRALANRLRRLESMTGNTGPCRACAGKCVTLRGAQPAPKCAVCGRELFAIRIVRDPDFFHNADRLRQVGGESQ